MKRQMFYKKSYCFFHILFNATSSRCHQHQMTLSTVSILASTMEAEAWHALYQNESIGSIRARCISFDRIMQSIVATMQRSVSHCPIRHESSGFGFLVHLLPAACQSTNLLVSSFAAIMSVRPRIGNLATLRCITSYMYTNISQKRKTL